MKPLAVVTPWFGAPLRGGAEQQARQIALRLAARGHAVEVLTTCARSFHDDWSNDFHPPGAADDGGLLVRRFRCDERDRAVFDRANARLLASGERAPKVGVSPVGDTDALDFVRHNINSSALVRHLGEERDGYRAFLFIPYLYGTTLAGLPAVARRALLQPCLHDEPYARLPAVEQIFRRARRILFNSEGERELALRLYGPGLHGRAVVVGEGVETNIADGETAAAGDGTAAGGETATTNDEASVTGDGIGARPGDALPAELRGARFVLYLGRRDATKNVPLLVGAYRRFSAARPVSDLKLVLAGEGRESFGGGGVLDLGEVSEGAKAALLRNARALFQPSRNESFSRAMMEAWLAGRPVAAHAECLATADAVERARGGWLAASEEEWAGLFARVADLRDEELNELGARGRAYAAEHADWDRVIDRYEQVLNELDADGITVGEGKSAALQSSSSRSSSRSELRAVHQLLPDFVFGDAISNQAVAVRGLLRGLGFESEIFAKRREAGVAEEARLVDEEAVEAGAGLIYHHSIGSEATALAVAHRGPKCLVYHNVTPHAFFAPYRPGFAWLLETGRASLPRLAQHFPCSVGDSPCNAAELSSSGFRDAGVLPIIVSPDKWNIEADRVLIEELQDGATNLLFVGRFAPNKRQDKLVRVFAEYARLDPGSRLVIAGEGHESDPYFRHVRDEIGRLGLGERVRITGRVTDAALLACYRTAHLYLSASEHEGFGVPLVESMWFDVPVLAARAGAVPDTVGDAALLFDTETDLREVARLAKLLARDDKDLRRRLVEAGRLRRESFTPRAVRPVIESLARRMELAARGEGHEATPPAADRHTRIA